MSKKENAANAKRLSVMTPEGTVIVDTDGRITGTCLVDKGTKLLVTATDRLYIGQVPLRNHTTVSHVAVEATTSGSNPKICLDNILSIQHGNKTCYKHPYIEFRGEENINLPVNGYINLTPASDREGVKYLEFPRGAVSSRLLSEDLLVWLNEHTLSRAEDKEGEEANKEEIEKAKVIRVRLTGCSVTYTYPDGNYSRVY